MKGFLKKVGIKIVLVVLGLVVGVGASFLYIQKFGIPFDGILQNVSKAEESKKLQETQQIIKSVGKLIILPEGEEPVLATITDAAALSKEQSFYAGSSNGDVVLVYQKAQKAIIYNPGKNIIVNVGAVSVQPGTQVEQNTLKTTTSTSTSEETKATTTTKKK